MRILGIVLLVLLVLIVAATGGLYVAGSGVLGHHEKPGTPAPEPRPAGVVEATRAGVAGAARDVGAPTSPQILFGDLHVHTTFSFDAFMLSMPLQGEGAHPPADACDFARFCSALDFWSINDHAEGITPQHWSETVDTLRQCNALAGDPDNPDTVAFLGWEWTQVGDRPEDHYGHKNVVLKHLDERIPARPIAATATVERTRQAFPGPLRRGLLAAAAAPSGGPRIHDFVRFLAERDDFPLCPEGVDVRELPRDCLEAAATPAELFRKLDQWGFPSLVIPHGTTWGFYTPPGSDWKKQLQGPQHDDDRQTLFEIYSGHGNSEVYRSWRAVGVDDDGEPFCPEPGEDYLPTCWRAGEILRERCLEAGTGAEACAERAAEARQLAAEAGHQAFLTVPGAEAEEWLDAGQCSDCDMPAFNYRPRGAAQYVLALSEFGDEAGDAAADDPRRFRFGFIASSDNHFARPGTGYKETHRVGFTESRGNTGDSALGGLLASPEEEPAPFPRPFDRETSDLRGFQLFEFERQTSYFMTGGLVAVHAEGRDRDAVWEALESRRVYGTSGPRILLWFDLLNPPDAGAPPLPMGGAVELAEPPRFRVRAVGSFEQLPGCPDYAVEGLGADEIERICKGECWNPGERRRPITRIEVVRIRPQATPGEPVERLIEDPWRSFECPADGGGCTVTFDDPDFEADGRDSVYYVRAFEPEKPGVNAGGVRCTRDARGECVEVDLCPGPEGADDDCLAPHEPRAWSSPIYVDASARGEVAARR